jgi:hypothetical protein
VVAEMDRVGRCECPMEVSFTLADELDPIAIYAALVASVVLIWDIIKWAREGPKLKLHVIVPAKIINQDDGYGGEHIRLRHSNKYWKWSDHYHASRHGVFNHCGR